MHRWRKTKSWVADLPSELAQFLSVDEVLAIHQRGIDEFGGEPGRHDLGLLESALYRPQTGYYDKLPELAAALFHSLLINQAFVDGNKRLAFFATDVFLRLNGWQFRLEADSAQNFIASNLSDGDFRYEDILKWVKSGLMENP